MGVSAPGFYKQVTGEPKPREYIATFRDVVGEIEASDEK
jgi:hypothetical protein